MEVILLRYEIARAKINEASADVDFLIRGTEVRVRRVGQTPKTEGGAERIVRVIGRDADLAVGEQVAYRRRRQLRDALLVSIEHPTVKLQLLITEEVVRKVEESIVAILLLDGVRVRRKVKQREVWRLHDRRGLRGPEANVHRLMIGNPVDCVSVGTGVGVVSRRGGKGLAWKNGRSDQAGNKAVSGVARAAKGIRQVLTVSSQYVAGAS